MESWIGIIGTLLGVALGGLATILTNHQRISYEKKQLHSNRQIEKIEKAHELLTEIDVKFRKYVGNDTTYLLTGIEPKESVTGRIPFEEIDMLFSFYAPSLYEEAIALIKICQGYGELSLQANISRPPTEGERKELLAKIMNKSTEINMAIKTLKENLSKLVQECQK